MAAKQSGMAKILLTGIAGFIGYWFARTMADSGVEIVGIDNLNPYYSPRLKLSRLASLGFTGLEDYQIDTDNNPAIPYGTTLYSTTHPALRFIRMEIADAAATALMERERFTHVVHLAAQAGVRYSIENPQAYQRSNLQGFLNVLEGCRTAKPDHLIYASSSSVYGANNKVPFAETDRTDEPVSLYAATKRSNELMASAYSTLYGLRATGLRFFTVYGPWGRPDMAPFIFAKAIMERKPIRVFNHGNMCRDFTYVTDIIEGMRRIVLDMYSPAFAPQAKNAPLHNIYNIGHGNPVALGEFISTLEELSGRKADKRYVGMQPGDVPVTYADTSLLAERYNYRPQTDLRTGLSHFTEWIQSHSALLDISPTT